MAQTHLEKPYYPIVYVRGYAPLPSAAFYDTYYGFAETSVEKREIAKPDYFKVDVFEGQLIRFLKLADRPYCDAVNEGLRSCAAPSRSIWICRFYDEDVLRGKLRDITAHAEDLRRLVCEEVPAALERYGVDLGPDRRDYKVILLAHSMGGLVCRTLLQNVLPAANEDPKRWVHRLVTMGSPHGGIELSNIAALQQLAAPLNIQDSSMFLPDRMRAYLKLEERVGPGAHDPYRYDVHSLGAQDQPYSFPVKRCFCLIGSDYQSYSAVQYATGDFSDGLVKQDRAYVVGGEAPPEGQRYAPEQLCYWANVHRAHSGRQGIVNSYESFENLRRFLFGDLKYEVSLEELTIETPRKGGVHYFYDFETLFSIRGTLTCLHRREQKPCGNAIRYNRDDVPTVLPLHTGFLNTDLRLDRGDPYSYLSMELRVVEHRALDLLHWDVEYSGRPIFAETLEVRVGAPGTPGARVQYRWLCSLQDFTEAEVDDQGRFLFPLRVTRGADGTVDSTVSGTVVVTASGWPDAAETLD